MKNTILVPVRFVLVCLILTTIFVGIYTLTVLGQAYDPGHGVPPGVVSDRLMDGLRAVYPVSVLVSLLITLFSVLRLSRFRFPALLLLFLVGAGALVGGIRGIELIRTDGTGPEHASVVPKVVYRFGGDFLYADRREGVSLLDVVVYRHGSDPGFSFSPEALVDPATGIVHISETGSDFRISDSESSYAHMFSGQPFISGLFRDVRRLSAALWNQQNPLAPSYLLLVGVVVLFVVSLWFLVRLTRWPLFNALAAFGGLRLLFLLYSFLQGSMFQEFMKAVVQPGYQRFVTTGVLLFVSVVLIVVNILLPPFDLWKREVERE
ncbi:hypothetical protein [Salinispira pacifica]